MSPQTCQFVAYYRLSKESRSGGLGLDAQREAVTSFLSSYGGQLLAEFTEIESGKRVDRAQLAAAIVMCRKTKAKLVIAKLDRLARNAAFLLTLRDSGVDLVAADMPHADRLTIGIMAIFAEHERDMISRRTKDALAQAKRRGIRLGCPIPKTGAAISSHIRTEKAAQHLRNLWPIVREIQAAGVTTLREIAGALNARGLRSSRGNSFSPQTVWEMLKRCEILTDNSTSVH